MKIPSFIKTKKFIIPAVIVLILAVVVMVKNKPDDTQVKGDEVKTVAVLEIKRQDSLSSKLTLQGTITPREYILLKSLVFANLRSLVPVGQNVSRGDIVARLSDTRIQESYFNSLQAVNDAQNNLQQTQALNIEAVTQANLALNSAASTLQLAQNNLVNTEALSVQDLNTVEDNATIAYQASYNLIEQVLRFWSDGSLVKFNLEDAIVANFELHSQTIGSFDNLKLLFNITSSQVGSDLSSALTTLEPVLDQVKDFNDLVFRMLNFTLSDNNLTPSQIDSLKAQSIVFTTQLNAQNASLKNARNSLASAAVGSLALVQSAQNQLNQALIQYDNAQAAVESAERQADIRELGARGQLTGNRTQLAGTQGQFDDLSLRAPFNGVVINHLVTAGDQITPGQPLLELGDISGIEINLAVDERSGRLISPGQEVIINDSVTGVIDEVAPAASLATGKVSLKVVAEADTSLIPGAVAEIQIQLNYSLPDLIIIPLSYVTVGQSETFVLVLEDGKVAKRVVKLSQVYDSHVEIIEGLAEGDQVIITNGEFLSVGEVVEIKN